MYPVAGQNKPIMARCWRVSTGTEEHDTGPMMACFYSPLAFWKIHTLNIKIKADLTKLPSACPVPHDGISAFRCSFTSINYTLSCIAIIPDMIASAEVDDRAFPIA